MNELPAGFTLDRQASPQNPGPALPQGFTLDREQRQPVDVPDLSHIEDEKQLLGEIGKLPDAVRQTALDKWATGRVEKDRARHSETFNRVGDAIGRMANSVPVFGGLTDEADALLNKAMGGDYGVQLAYSRAQQKAQNNAETPKISTPFGDIHESGVEKAAGTIAGALALPFTRVTSGTGFLPGAADATANAIPYVGLDAFGRGEGSFEQRLSDSLKALTGPGVVTPSNLVDTALLGGGLGKIQRQFQPPTQQPPNASGAPTRADVVQAADRQNITVPDFLATDSGTKRSVAGFMASQPITGLIVRNAADESALQTGTALRRTSDDFSNAGTGLVQGATDPTAAASTAGHQIRDSLEKWIKTDSSNTLTGMYDNVYNKTNKNNTYNIQSTRNAVADLMAESQRSATPTGMQIANSLDEALSRMKGLSVDGIQGLRTYVGNLLQDTVLPGAGTVQPGLKRVYGALTDDLKFALGREGGKSLVSEWEQANATAKLYSEQRQNLTKIIGIDAGAAPERVVDRLIAMAGTKGGADMQQLMLAHAKTPTNVWNELSAAAIRRLGEGNASQVGSPGQVRGFSPDAFLTSWNKLSDNGKHFLFGSSTLRQSLDDIATISDRFRDIRRFQNPSGTAQVAGATSLLTQLGAALAGNPALAASAVAQVGTSAVISALLSRPASAQAVRNWSGHYVNYLQGATGPQAMKLATIMLAKHVSDVTGEDEKEVTARLDKLTGGQQ